MRPKHWIESAIGKHYLNYPVEVGVKNGRKLYEICWTDGSYGEYFIDWDSRTIEEYYIVVEDK